jgi:hypothetical protein
MITPGAKMRNGEIDYRLNIFQVEILNIEMETNQLNECEIWINVN